MRLSTRRPFPSPFHTPLRLVAVVDTSEQHGRSICPRRRSSVVATSTSFVQGRSHVDPSVAVRRDRLDLQQRSKMLRDVPRPIHTLLIDNYDSYTYNLYHYLAEANGALPTVVRNDQVEWEVLRTRLEGMEFDNVVISPGPGTPANPQDIGVCMQVLQQCIDLPVLGVCLGHQALGLVHGASVVRAPYPAHGYCSQLRIVQHKLFAGIPVSDGFSVVRYHSLVLDETTLPPCLEPIAWTTEDSVLMGIAHTSRPHFGVQFHPESVCTEHGKAIISNFRDLTLQQLQRRSEALGPITVDFMKRRSDDEVNESNSMRSDVSASKATTSLKMRWIKLDECLDSTSCTSEHIFLALYGDSEDSVWLDSSSTEGSRARFSFMGSRGGRFWKRVKYLLPPVGEEGQGTISVEYSDGSKKSLCIGIWDYLDEELTNLHLHSTTETSSLPFDFHGGFVGYFGYELKSTTCGRQAHNSFCPDACLFFMDRFLAIDHKMNDIYVVVLDEDDRAGCSDHWMKDAVATIHSQALRNVVRTTTLSDKWESTSSEIMARMLPARDSEKEYIQKVEECIDLMVQGESYEICLTTCMETIPEVDPLVLYRVFRTINPAPYSAWLSFADGPTLCCCSPERFLKLDRHGTVEAKPIKGTAKRSKDNKADDLKLAEDLRNSVKDRAENLMIVDLLRNDLSQFCEVGTVKVPKLMHIESYSTVHQLVSTVVGQRCAGLKPTECIRAAFPGGSMTGAPKKRTMEILDKLEKRARGPYSGSIGFLSLNGTFDLNIVIRTGIINDGNLIIGAGGAVTVLSDPKSEFEEMQLKARALCKGIEICKCLIKKSAGTAHACSL
mmetsp:Transcript_2142/g.14094  ORF Transcript_2142/g.14094 Transcript_2142/m.14094 type:complete len:836 (+) Transcript_2142:1597-4104(+)